MTRKRPNIRRIALLFALAASAVSAVVFVLRGEAQNSVTIQTSPIVRIGEKLSYSLSLGRFSDAGYAETHVVSRGKISGRDAIEVRSRVKTWDLVSAAFFMIDEARTVYAAPDTLSPLYVLTNSNDSAIPRETVQNFLTQPPTGLDVITLLFKLRETAGNGTFSFMLGDDLFVATAASSTGEKVRTPAGEFETTIVTVQSEALTAYGIREMRINLSNDDFRVPVLFRFKTPKGELRATLSGISLPEPEATPTPTATPVRTPTPKPVTTPTPDTYVDDLPLSPELGFRIGESLEYNITSASKPVAVLALTAKERRKINKRDSLVLTATITSVAAGVMEFTVGDIMTATVDPETLAPIAVEVRKKTPIAGLSPAVAFDPVTGAIRFGPEAAVDAPIGTHSLLSLVYAMRSFNLKPSKTRSNPVNDTRVAVFWDGKASILTLRPSEPEDITIAGAKTSAQLIAINANHPQLDALGIKVWLSTEQRVPLRFSVGAYQAELIVKNSALFR